MSAEVYIDDGFATDADAELWREFVRQRCRAGHDKPIRHYTWHYALLQQALRESRLHIGEVEATHG
jgi:hypothetical protein